jgi:ribosome-associated heat shock protein Hsp15
MDKWLWAVRLFKTRGIAAEMCANGKIKRAGNPVKASTTPHPGDELEIPFSDGPGARNIAVVSIIQQRVASQIALTCYSESTKPEVFEAQKNWHAAKQENPKGRPTKKNRRDIDKIHGFLD